MILLKKLNGEEFILSRGLIEAIMGNPDTTILLTNSKHPTVREPKKEVVDKVVEFRRETFKGTLDQIKG